MKGTDKAIVLGVVMAVVLAAFYFMVLSPKRDEASSLKEDNAKLQSQIDQQKQVAAFAEDAKAHFATYYGRLVVLGKAVPADADTASLLVQLNSIAGRTGVEFNGLTLSAAGDTATTPTSAPTGTSAPSTSTSTTPASTTPTTAASEPTSPVPATEAMAANMPLGASVGPAGLPTMPYALTFKGTYFDVADFLKGVDDLVHPRGGSGMVAADGRLLTIDGFSLSPSAESTNFSDPDLEVTLSVTSYVTPAAEGLTAGATPGGPAPAIGQPQAQPASATVTP